MQTFSSSDHVDPAPPAFRSAVTLRDGTHVTVRRLTLSDATAHGAFLDSLKAYRRTLPRLPRRASCEMVDRGRLSTPVGSTALVALVRVDAHERIVAVARYRPDVADGCECAVEVLPEWRQKGLGTLLLRRLLQLARAEGMQHAWSLVSAEDIALTTLMRQERFEAYFSTSDDGAKFAKRM